ncbi:MAG: hypothetical protein F6K22_17595 [Okeania sp. SIO2F4]|uniref:hypothetical protein n=1 Tax=Okeania sp. SIO2F4 TaxID=2607790 RepID=UPI001429188E|nr:hypothetical protein [Okeania sp. SIO2F4]NES04480.1 hypothetical protein [Okeania sp. SIO2F4]
MTIIEVKLLKKNQHILIRLSIAKSLSSTSCGSITWENEDKVWKFLSGELPEKVREDGEY